MASYSSIPSNIILKIAENLDARDFCALLRTNKHAASVLTPFLPGLACQALYASKALKVSIGCHNQRMIQLLLTYGEMDTIKKYWSGRGRHIKREGAPPPVLRRVPLTREDWEKNCGLIHMPIPKEFLCEKEG